MTAKKIAAGSTNAAFRQQKIDTCREIIRRVINENPILKTSLGSVIGIEDIYIRIMSKESSLNESIYITNMSPSTFSKHISKGSPRKAYNIITSIRQDSFVREVVLPHGVGQVMGYHLVRSLDGNSFRVTYGRGGPDLFELVKKKNGNTFLVNANDPVESINLSFQGPDALENGIRAGLCLLASKYGFTKNIRSAIVAYHGGGKDVFGTSSNSYANDILNGTTYLAVAQPNAKNNLTLAKNVNTSPETNSNKAAKVQWSCTT